MTVARWRILEDAARVAEAEAALRAVPVIREAAWAQAEGQYDEQAAANGFTRRRSKRLQHAAGASKADKAIYAAAVCVGKWAELRETLRKAEAARGAAEKRIEGDRAAAAAVLETLGALEAAASRPQKAGAQETSGGNLGAQGGEDVMPGLEEPMFAGPPHFHQLLM